MFAFFYLESFFSRAFCSPRVSSPSSSLNLTGSNWCLYNISSSSLSLISPGVGVSSIQIPPSLFLGGGVLIGMGVGFCLKNGLKGSGGYTWLGAEGFLSSISD